MNNWLSLFLYRSIYRLVDTKFLSNSFLASDYTSTSLKTNEINRIDEYSSNEDTDLNTGIMFLNKRYKLAKKKRLKRKTGKQISLRHRRK